MARKSNGRRIALGHSERDLARGLEFAVGAPIAATEAPTPRQVATAAIVKAVITEDEEILALMAKIEEAKAKKADKAAKIAALRAELAALQADE
jgi:hypothetical protein